MQETPASPSFCSGKLIPILREGVDVVKMIVFRELKELAERNGSARSTERAARLAGAVLNELFGAPSLEPEFLAFAEAHREEIAHLFRLLPERLEKLRIPLTDALRISVLCDYQEGRDNANLLERAQRLGILLVDRDMPMPHTFIELVRRLGVSYGLLSPMAAPPVQ